MTNTSALHSIPVLTDAECARVRLAVLALRPHWTKRIPSLPFYTLGTVSYIDAVGDEPPYATLVPQGNRVLRLHFGWLYERLLVLLSQALGRPAVFAETTDGPLGLPGFHIHLSDPAFESDIAPVHFDLQYRLHDWRGLSIDRDHPISFTLAIALPQHGGGLRTWDVSLTERRTRADESPEELAQGREAVFHAYRCGHLALHSGHLMHQIAPGIDLQPQDERITLQGHGVYADGLWRLYW